MLFPRAGFFSRKRRPKEQVQEHLNSLGAKGVASDLSMNGCEGLVLETPSTSIVSSTRTVALWRNVNGNLACATMVSPKLISVEEVARECAETLATVQVT
jgi:RNA 3'-terminal phosphate cyclase